jgi:hypothetical protein
MNVEIQQIQADKWIALANSGRRGASLLPIATGKTLEECAQNLAAWERAREARGTGTQDIPAKPGD